ncbi:MAG: biopolymer transporter ExbD [Pseudomonadota bacterium]
MTPLIDVVFILLVFFMLASSFLDWRSIKLASAGQAAGGGGVEGALLVELTPQGVRLSGERLSETELATRLSARLAESPEQRLLLRPAPGVEMQGMVQLMDLLAAAGARDIALLPGSL